MLVIGSQQGSNRSGSALLCMTPTSLQVPPPTQDSDGRDKGYPVMVHKVIDSDTSYLTHRRQGSGLQEYTEGGSPKPAIDAFPRAARALPNGVHPVSPRSDLLGFSRAQGRRGGGGKAHPGFLQAHSLGATSCQAERGFTFPSRHSGCQCSSFCHLLHTCILAWATALAAFCPPQLQLRHSCLPAQAPAQEFQATPLPFFHLTASQVFQLTHPGPPHSTLHQADGGSVTHTTWGRPFTFLALPLSVFCWKQMPRPSGRSVRPHLTVRSQVPLLDHVPHLPSALGADFCLSVLVSVCKEVAVGLGGAPPPPTN